MSAGRLRCITGRDTLDVSNLDDDGSMRANNWYLLTLRSSESEGEAEMRLGTFRESEKDSDSSRRAFP